MKNVFPTPETWSSGEAQASGWQHLGNVAVERPLLDHYTTGDTAVGSDLPVAVIEKSFSLAAPYSDPLIQRALDGFDPGRADGQLYSTWCTGPSINAVEGFGEYPPTQLGQEVGIFVQLREP